jgi:cation transport regulator ChaB
MPYSTISQLPAHLHKYPEIVQRQWMHVFNSIYDRTNKDESRAFKAANSILTKRIGEKHDGNSPEHFSMLVDKFLKNI